MKAKLYRDFQKRQLVQKHFKKRQLLKAIIKNTTLDLESRQKAWLELEKLPRDSSKTRVRNRCQITGRGRGIYRKFRFSRIILRKFAMEAKIPGLTKASWL